MRRPVVAVAGLVLFLLCMAGGVLLVAFGSSGGLSIHSIPVYPRATNVDVIEYGGTPPPANMTGSSTVWVGGGSSTGVAWAGGARGGTIFFRTTDSDQQVYDFYDKRLRQAGWFGGIPYLPV